MNSSRPPTAPPGTLRLPHWILGSTGFVLLLAILGVALKVPNPSEFQHLVFRVFLGMSAAALAVPIIAAGGNIGVDAMKEAGIQAGGAIAVFVVIYMWNPASKFAKAGDRSPPGEPAEPEE